MAFYMLAVYQTNKALIDAGILDAIQNKFCLASAVCLLIFALLSFIRIIPIVIPDLIALVGFGMLIGYNLPFQNYVTSFSVLYILIVIVNSFGRFLQYKSRKTLNVK